MENHENKVRISEILNLPFQYELTYRCRKFIEDCESSITGYCSGNICDYSKKLFFRASFDHRTKSAVESEYNILSELQEYDFIPRFVAIKNIGKYHIVFTECIEAISLNEITFNDPRFYIGIKGAFDILHKLYTERGFLHFDMALNNIMIDSNNKVYLIDFETSYLSKNRIPDKSWGVDFLGLIEAIHDHININFEWFDNFNDSIEFLRYSGCLDCKIYQEKYLQYLSLLFQAQHPNLNS